MLFRSALIGNWTNNNGLYLAFGEDGTGYIADNWNWPGAMNGVLFSYSVREFYGSFMIDIVVIQSKGETVSFGSYPMQSSDSFATLSVFLAGNESSVFTKSM